MGRVREGLLEGWQAEGAALRFETWRSLARSEALGDGRPRN
jgi:hypothetical protein